MNKRDLSKLIDEEGISKLLIGQKRNKKSMQETHSKKENMWNKVEFEKHYKMSNEKCN